MSEGISPARRLLLTAILVFLGLFIPYLIIGPARVVVIMGAVAVGILVLAFFILVVIETVGRESRFASLILRVVGATLAAVVDVLKARSPVLTGAVLGSFLAVGAGAGVFFGLDYDRRFALRRPEVALRDDLLVIRSELEEYRDREGHYPPEGPVTLATLCAEADLEWSEIGEFEGKPALLDPWGNPYVYRRTVNPGPSYALYSMGPDGIDDGGEDDDVPVPESML